MAKKNYAPNSNDTILSSVIGWKPPVLHQKSECYISFLAFDPGVNRMRKKKIMLDHIKGKRNQRVYADQVIKKLTEKLMAGWNPWIEELQPLEYTKWDDVLDRYKSYLAKMCNEGSMREETYVDYSSRLRILEKWKQEKRITLNYSYQWDRGNVSKFLDYIFIDRNNTVLTRNNYLAWTKSFSAYLLARGYIPKNPTEGLERIKNRQKKSRDVIPDCTMQLIRDYLQEHNRHYLLACEIIHYLFIRPREMSYLRICDIHVKTQTLTLHGENTKNGNDAVITLPTHVIKLMLELNIFSHPGQDYLFSDGFMPGSERKNEKMFRDYWTRVLRKELKLSPRFKFYSLKDTGITNMLRANTDVLSVRDQARHSSILITDIYTPKDIQKANEYIKNYQGIL